MTFVVTTELRAWASQNAPGIDIDHESATFRNHEFSRAITDWPSAWRKWILRAVTFGATNGNGRPAPASEPEPWYEVPARLKAVGAELGIPWSEDGWINGRHMSYPAYAQHVRRVALQTSGAEHER